MKKNYLKAAIWMLTAFALWTIAVRYVDVQAIGPQESSVGFATMNRFVHNLTGVHMDLYTITDWLGLVPVAVCLLFALLHVWQFAVVKQDITYFLLMVQYLVPGLVLAWAYEHSGTLWTSIAIHAAANALSAWAML